MVSASQVREKLREVLFYDLDLFAFEEWLDHESRGMFAGASQDAIDLVSEAERLFSEYYRGDKSIAELEEGLGQLIHVVSFIPASPERKNVYILPVRVASAPQPEFAVGCV